ncbi:hypothetical protein DET49_11258 [Salegentibacter sp. 24]|uniref:hypothetical protein n=1 Tax=Salegentibacter sp. 24 TaxID=2183986 RepID=UPI00105C5348|nr:hypothetical protein [Salegentibacter sp. 24]TDN87368.1 hypothetical protein DET49_11258 [Salegentibacter sp. 24]
MKDRKNIDRLYQEKFRDFTPEPRPELWNNIAEKLQEKDRKKPFIVPFWFRVGGVAAVLAIILGGYFFTENNFPNTQVVFEIKESAKPHITFPEIKNNEQFIKASKILRNFNEEIYSSPQDTKASSTNNTTAIALGNTNSKSEKNVADSAKKEITGRQNNINSGEQYSSIDKVDHQNSEKEKIQHQDFINSKNKQKFKAIAKNKTDKFKEENQLSIKDSLEVAEQLAQIRAEKNREKDENFITEASKKNLSLSTFAAPVFYDNMGSGSAIAPQFAGNSTSSQVSMAYGLNLAYAISDKIKIRSGISKVGMSYNVEGIVFTASINPDNISSINYESDRNTVQLDNAAPSGLPMDSDPLNNSAFTSNTTSLPGAINQQFGFIEIPLEIEYSLIDKKIGLNLIAGGSSLFLDENSIQVNTNNQNTRIGEANNINKVSFSTNIGVGLDYKLTDSFQLNLEPIFKYQLDTFRDAPGVKPFYFGLYSGISFNF